MPEQAPDVGRRVRALRAARGLSLRSLAQASDLSLNAISLIERGQTSPTVSSLHRLAGALGVRIVDLFGSEDGRSVVYLRAGQDSQTRGNGSVVASLATGLTDQRLQPLLATLAPGAASGAEPITHGGQEFVFVLGGRLDYVVAGQTYRMSVGDSLLFEASLPHGWQNASEEEASFLLVLEAVESPGAQLLSHLEAT